MAGSCRTSCVVVIGSILILLVLGSFGASSNPIAPPGSPPSITDTTFRIEDPTSGILLLIIINILVNLFWMCVLLLALGKRFGVHAMEIPATGLALVLRVVLVAALVTLIGAFVDYAFVMGIDPDYSERYKVILFDPLNWSVALGIIFLSIVSSAYIFLNMPLKPLLLLAGVITALNPVWWVLTGTLGNDVPMATIIISALILPIALKGLLDLHRDLAFVQGARAASKARDSPRAQ